MVFASFIEFADQSAAFVLIDFALIVLAALLGNLLFSRCSLPGILGMIAAGILLGPSGLNLLGPAVLDVLREFKTLALIVILLRAGLGISRATLNQIGGQALRMGFIPCVAEGLAVAAAGHVLLGLSILEAGMLGFIVGAVSPAVVVPAMLGLKQAGLGGEREVPTLVLAGSSLDNVVAITIFGAIAGMAAGGSVNLGYVVLGIPLGIVVGGLMGVMMGHFLVALFRAHEYRNTTKAILILVLSVLFYEAAEWREVKDLVPVASLLGIMAVGFVILEKHDALAHRLAEKLSNIWILAEILLFVFIGAEVRLAALDSSLVGTGLLILTIGLSVRSLGVWASLIGSGLEGREKLFCVIAYLPKATVQAAIGAVPLAMVLDGQVTDMSVATGETILAIAVLSIVVTAPLGAIGVKYGGRRLLRL